jgi:multiple RNA-binding domain-containing protein 1
VQIGDKSLPRPWSAHSAGSTANLQKTVQNQKKQEPVKPAEKDTKKDAHKEELEKKKQHFAKLYEDMENPKLKEYLDVMS